MTRLMSPVFSGVLLVLGIAYEAVALRLPAGAADAPGPGLYPRLVGLLWLFTAAVCFIEGVRTSRRTESKSQVARELGRAMTVAVAVTVYALVFERLGFVLSIFLLALVGARIFGYKKWSGAIVYAGVTVAAVWVLFGILLKVPLPHGFLG